MPDDEKPIPRSELEAWRKKAVDTLRVCYRDSVTAETADQTLRLIREVERLREGLRTMLRLADGLAGEQEYADDWWKAEADPVRALLPEDDEGKEVKRG